MVEQQLENMSLHYDDCRRRIYYIYYKLYILRALLHHPRATRIVSSLSTFRARVIRCSVHPLFAGVLRVPTAPLLLMTMVRFGPSIIFITNQYERLLFSGS